MTNFLDLTIEAMAAGIKVVPVELRFDHKVEETISLKERRHERTKSKKRSRFR